MRKKFFAGLLALVMLLSLVPVAAFAAEGEARTGVTGGTTTTGGMVLTKTAQLQSDGTYTINLEAFATGTTTTTQVEKKVPLDIVLVLDQSGSMSSNMTTTTYSQVSTSTTNSTVYSRYSASYNKTTYYALVDGEYKQVSITREEVAGEASYTKYDDYSTYNSTVYGNYEDGTKYYYLQDDGTYAELTITRSGSYTSRTYTYSVGGTTISTSSGSYTECPIIDRIYTLSTNSTYKYTYTAAGMTAVVTDNDAANDRIPLALYTATTSNSSTTRHDALVTAADNFIAKVQADAVSGSVDHRMAIVGFASTGNSYTNTEILSTADAVNYDDATDTDYAAALVSVNNNGAINTRLTTAVSRLDTDGDTYSEYGIDMANKIFAQHSVNGTERKRIVIMFTDGYTAPNNSDDFKYSMANNAINHANTSKTTYNATVYSIAVLEGADPTADITTNFQTSDGWSNNSNNLSDTQEVTAMNRYMHYTSSNYSGVTSLTDTGTRVTGKDCYLVASDAAGLNSIFESIFEDEVSSGTTVTLTEEAVMRDIMTPGAFQLPAGFNASSQITVKTQVVETTDGETYTTGEVTTYTSTDGINFVNGDKTITVSANTETDTIDVSGFNYSEKFVAPSHAGEKLMITITGIEATEGAATGETVYTNDEKSGIYENGEQVTPIVSFPTPDTTIQNKSYVMDYAKPFTFDASTEWGSTGVSHLATSMAKFTSGITALDLTNGKVSVNGTTLTYTPQTMSWKGYDKFFSFGTQGKDANDNDIYQWAKVNVIPANNVYYEDTFKDTTATEGTAGTVGIVYSNNVTVGTAGANTETSNNSVMGWIDSMADDKTDSDGTATEMKFPESGATATATFTFTGTGVDVYSRTDLQSGVIVGSLFVGDKTVATKTLMVDTLAVSAGEGSYYNIPTLSFSGLDYADENGEPITYKVKLTVTRGKAVQMENGEPVVDENGDLVYSDTEKRSTYYLDGIRIYNPLGDVVTDDTVIDAYDPDKSLGADVDTDSDGTVDATEPAEMIQSVFTEVREILDASDNRVVFIDVDEEGNVASSDYAVSEVNKTYGPKNEVYLAPGQSVVFAIDGYVNTDEYYVGLKSLTGSVIAAFSDEEGGVQATINHTTDLYYAVTPTADGKVIIKNNSSEGILSVTKLQAMIAGTAAEPAVFALRAVSDEEATTYATSFAAFSLRDYEQPAVEEPEVPAEPEIPVDPETPSEPTEPENPEEPTDPETPEEPTEPEVPDIDVDIENPEPEEKPEQKPNHTEVIKKLVKHLFNKLLGWFGR